MSNTEKTFIVQLPEFTIEALDANEAATQAAQIFIDFPSSRECTVREVGCDDTVKRYPDTYEIS